VPLVISKDVALKNSSNDTLMYLDRNMNPFDHDIFSGQESQDNEDDSADDENQELYTICLVTCYSEGKRGLRNTLNSLASTKYDDTKKLLFIIADGLIKGEGNDQLTSDIILSFISENYHQYKNPRSQMPEPQSYVSIGIGNKLKNMARVVKYYILFYINFLLLLLFFFLFLFFFFIFIFAFNFLF